MADEAAVVDRTARESPEVLLQSRQRTVESDGDDGCGVGDGKDVDPTDPWPPPRDERSDGHEEDEREVDDEHEVSQTGVHLMRQHQTEHYVATNAMASYRAPELHDVN